MEFLKRNILLLVVFLTGGAVLVIEVVAVRILSPYFGNTMFTVSSVLGVILSALSLGYYTGGRFADRHAEERWFYRIILLSGLLVLLLAVLTQTLLPYLGYRLPVTFGPLIASLLLFFVPAFFLGTLSPFVVALQQKNNPDVGVGTVSGAVFFWSTLGSISGSFLAGFVLIPQFGVSEIMRSTGLFLVVLGLLPLTTGLNFKKRFLPLALLVPAGLYAFAGIPAVHSQNLIYQSDGLYEQIRIFDGEYQGRPARFLEQDRSHSAAMFLDSDELVFGYTQYYQVYPAFTPHINRALVIGGGGYSLPKALLAEGENVQVDVAEIEPELLTLSQKYFRVGQDPRLQNFVVDGRRFLHDTPHAYDVIFSDVYRSLYSIPAHFTTAEFFALAKEKLSENGIFMANIIADLHTGESSLLLSELNTFSQVFPHFYLFAVDDPESSNTQNFVLVGHKSENGIDENKLGEYQNHLVNTKKFDLSKHLILTDNFAPVDDLTAGVLRRNQGQN